MVLFSKASSVDTHLAHTVTTVFRAIQNFNPEGVETVAAVKSWLARSFSDTSNMGSEHGQKWDKMKNVVGHS